MVCFLIYCGQEIYLKARSLLEKKKNPTHLCICLSCFESLHYLSRRRLNATISTYSLNIVQFRNHATRINNLLVLQHYSKCFKKMKPKQFSPPFFISNRIHHLAHLPNNRCKIPLAYTKISKLDSSPPFVLQDVFMSNRIHHLAHLPNIVYVLFLYLSSLQFYNIYFASQPLSPVAKSPMYIGSCCFLNFKGSLLVPYLRYFV